MRRPAILAAALALLGEFDGGMRTLGGNGYLMFGADVMARLTRTRT